MGYHDFRKSETRIFFARGLDKPDQLGRESRTDLPVEAEQECEQISSKQDRAPLAGPVFGGIWAAAGMLFLAMFVRLPWTHG